MWKEEALGADEGAILRNALSANWPSRGAAWRAAARALDLVALRVSVRGAGDGFRGAEGRWRFFEDRARVGGVITVGRGSPRSHSHQAEPQQHVS